MGRKKMNLANVRNKLLSAESALNPTLGGAKLERASATALVGIFDLVLTMAQAEEDEKTGEWGQEWYVEVPGKPPFKVDTDTEAYELANHAALTVPVNDIRVYVREVERHKREHLSKEDWYTPAQSDPDESPADAADEFGTPPW